MRHVPLLALWAALASAGPLVRPAAAQCHVRGRVAYHAPYAVHVPYKAVVVEKVVKAVPVYVAPAYYYSVSDGYRDTVLAEAAAFRAALLMSRLQPPAGPLPRVPGGPAPSLPPAGTPGLTPPAAPEAPAGGVSPELAKVVEARCVKCHAAGKNGIDLSAAALPRLTRTQWLDCAMRVNLDGPLAMPQGGPALKPEEVSLFAAQAYSNIKK
jgi:cytochrome c5